MKLNDAKHAKASRVDAKKLNHLPESEVGNLRLEPRSVTVRRRTLTGNQVNCLKENEIL